MDTSHPKIRLLLRSLYLLEFERARQQVEEIRALESDLGLVADAILCFYLGELEEAEELFGEATDAGVEDPTLPLYLALTLKEQGRLADAVGVLERGTERFPGDDTLASTLGRLYTESGQPGKTLERLRTEKPGQGTVEARRSRGEALERLGHAEAALTEYEAAIREFPFDEGLMDRARALYVASGLAERGVQFFAGLQKKRQLDRLALLNNLGRLQLAVGRLARVDEVCKKLEATIPNDHFALPYLVALLEQLGKRKKIKSLAQKYCTDEVAVEIRADVACGVARAYRDEGRASRARETVEAALRLAPFHRGLAELRAGLAGVDDGPPSGADQDLNDA